MRFRLAALILAVIVLSGCSKVPIVTLWKLRSFRIETADLSPLRVAVRAPGWIVPTPESGKVAVTYWSESDENSKRIVTVRLKRANRAEDQAALTEVAGSEPITIFEIDRRDLATAADAQDAVRRRKQEVTAPFRAEVTIDRAGCRSADVPSGSIPFDLYVHTDDATGWLPFLLRYNLRPDAVHEKEFLEKFAEHVPRCGKLANRAAPTRASR
jgi:hypothetical protein